MKMRDRRSQTGYGSSSQWRNRLLLIATGNSSKLIADQLFITGETVKGQIKKILSSLGANDRTRACHHRA